MDVIDPDIDATTAVLQQLQIEERQVQARTDEEYARRGRGGEPNPGSTR